MAMLTSNSDFIRSLLTFRPHKPGQGTLARGGTLLAIGVLILAGMYSWSQVNVDSAPAVKWGLPLVVGAMAGWVAYRLIHYQPFADFLIYTEVEVNKVSWPTRSELRASTIVVLVNILLMAIFLFMADTFWKWLLKLLGILKIGGLLGGGSMNMSIPPLLPMLADWFVWL